MNMLTNEIIETEPLEQQGGSSEGSVQSSSAEIAESSIVCPTTTPKWKLPSPLRKFSSQSSNDADSSHETSESTGSPSTRPSKWDYRKKLHELQTRIEDQDGVICKLTKRVVDAEVELEKKSSELLSSLLAVEEAEVIINQLRHRVNELENTRKTL